MSAANQNRVGRAELLQNRAHRLRRWVTQFSVSLYNDDAFTTDSPNYLFAGTSDAAASKARTARARFSRRCCARAQQVFRLMILLPQRPQPAMTSRRRGRRSESRCLAVAGRRRGCAIAETPFRRESAVPTPSRGAKVSRRPKFRSQSRSWCRGGRGHRFENRKIATREFSVSKNFGTLT